MNPGLQWLSALFASLGVWVCTGVLSWGLWYAIIISRGKPSRLRPPSHASSIDDFLVDTAFLRIFTTLFTFILLPFYWAARTGSTLVQYGISNWKLIVLTALLLWADLGVVEYTSTTLEMVDYTYTHFLGEFFHILKMFLNPARIILDIVTPPWNLFWFVARRVPIDVMEATIECVWMLLVDTYRTLGAFMLDLVKAIDVWIERPGMALNLVPALYDLQGWADAVVASITCWCADLGDVAKTVGTLITTPSTAWAVSNFTNIPIGMLVSVAANATGPPAIRPNFDLVLNPMINTITSWSITVDTFVNSVAGLLLRGDPTPTCTEVLGPDSNYTCTVDHNKPGHGCGGWTLKDGYVNPVECPVMDCFYDGRDNCTYFFIPHMQYFLARTPKINRRIPFPFVEKGFSLNVPAKWHHFVAYTAVTWLEAIKVLLRTLVHIDKLRPTMVFNTTAPNATAAEKAELWEASAVFTAWRAANTFFWDAAFFFVNHDSVPSFIRYTPVLWGEFINRWVDLFELLYNVAMNLIVGVVDVAENVIPIRVLFNAFVYDWNQYLIEPAQYTCHVAGLWGGNYEVDGTEYVFPVGCVLEGICNTGVQAINNTAYLLGYVKVLL